MNKEVNLPEVIQSWEELGKIPPSNTHKLVINLELYNGCIISLTDENDFYYLSTHTFYDPMREERTKKLQEYGFNIVLARWG